MRRKRDSTKIRRVETENTGRHEKKDMANVICLSLVVEVGNVQHAQISKSTF
jgi:hypothetical protein